MTAKQVLIVDDDDDIRETLGLALLYDGYTVKQAINGRDALNQLHSGSTSPAVVVLDMRMPILDGRGFMAELRKVPAFAAIQVILCSANPNLADLAAELGVAAYLAKPAEYLALAALIARLDARAGTAEVSPSVPKEMGRSAMCHTCTGHLQQAERH